MEIYSVLQSKWHYIKYVLILRREITNRTRKKFYSIGKNSIISKPLVQLAGENQISIGYDTTILSGCRLSVYGDKISNEPAIQIGNRCYLSFGISILGSSTGKVKIGDNVLFASNIMVTNENHGINPESDIPYMAQPLSIKDVEVSDGCWIGENVCILPGVKIGKKCVIGAGSIVTKSIPDYCIAVGIPARVIKKYNFNTHRWEKYEEERDYNGKK